MRRLLGVEAEFAGFVAFAGEVKVDGDGIRASRQSSMVNDRVRDNSEPEQRDGGFAKRRSDESMYEAHLECGMLV